MTLMQTDTVQLELVVRISGKEGLLRLGRINPTFPSVRAESQRDFPDLQVRGILSAPSEARGASARNV